jgi:hypothetical protein
MSGGCQQALALGTFRSDRELDVHHPEQPIVDRAGLQRVTIASSAPLSSAAGQMLLIQNKRVNWETHQIRIPGATAKD